MPFYVFLGALAVTSSILVLWWGFSGPTTRSTVRDNLGTGAATTSTVPADYRELDLGRSGWDRLIRPVVDGFTSRARRLTTSGLADHLGHQIALAGLRDKWPVERLLAVKLALLGITIFIEVWYFMSQGLTRTGVALGLMALFAAYVIPDAMLARAARDRQAQIERELPDVIDQITVSIESGLGFDSALTRAARAGTGVFAEELRVVLQDMQVGLTRDAAFDRLLGRTDVADLRHVVLAIRQSDRYGLPIAQTLRVQAEELRDKRRARAEERAMKIPVKIVFPLVFCILPALFIVVLGPAVLSINDAF